MKTTKQKSPHPEIRRIMQLRKQNQITQKALAVKAGIYQPHLCALEKGERIHPSYNTVDSLQKAINFLITEKTATTNI